MAAPAEITLKNLNGQWVMNKELSDSYDAVLKTQGVNWLMRKVVNMAAVVLTIKEWVDETDGLTHLTIESKPQSGLPASTEVRVLNFEPVELNHPLFGKIRGKTRWCKLSELDTEYLGTGFEDGIESVIHMYTDHTETGAITQQVAGFENINGTRYHTRHIVVKKGKEELKVRMVYDYMGTIPEETK